MKRKKLILQLCYDAISIALFVVLDRFSITFGTIKISMSGLPIILASLYFGPINGMIVGFCCGFISQMLGYGFTLTTMLWIWPHVSRGSVMGVVGKLIDVEKRKPLFVISVIISSIIVTLFNTLAICVDSLVYHYYSEEYVFGMFIYRLLLGILTGIIYALIILPILKVVKIKKD